jgi:hypothetical protein
MMRKPPLRARSRIAERRRKIFPIGMLGREPVGDKPAFQFFQRHHRTAQGILAIAALISDI